MAPSKPSSSSIPGNNKDHHNGDIDNEETPLLTHIAPVPTFSEPIETNPSVSPQNLTRQQQQHHSIHDTEDEDAPLPRTQIFLLCYTRIVEPIAFFSIFPYVNSMIEKVGGVEKEDVGFYSGLIESLFSLTQMCVMIFWGKAADRWGRKPCLVFSLFGVTVTTALFGTSQSLAQMVLFRCLAGVFSGTLVTVRAMISENSTRKTQARAFSYFAFAGNLGIFAGPLIGGGLERPVDKFPWLFGRIRFFHEHPYALPGFMTALIGLSAAIVSLLFVKETLHLHHGKKRSDEASMTIWQLIRYPGVGNVMIIYNYILLLAFAFTAANPVFLYTPVDLGGIGFQPGLIAAAIALNGVAQAIWLLLIFPPLHKRIGTGGILRASAFAWPVFFSVNPICNWLLRNDLKAAFWAIAPTNVVLGSGVAMSFTANQLAVNDIAPTHETLGTLNAVVMATASGLRAFVPALSTSLYATGVKYDIMNGQLFWVVIIVFAVGLSFVLRLLPKKAEGKGDIDDEDEDET